MPRGLAVIVTDVLQAVRSSETLITTWKVTVNYELSFSEMLTISKSKQGHGAEDKNQHLHGCKNLKPRSF
jgi:hypothetical protein